jgi:acetyl esterase/lipase
MESTDVDTSTSCGLDRSCFHLVVDPGSRHLSSASRTDGPLSGAQGTFPNAGPDADKDVPDQESLAMVEALQAAGADAELVTVPRCRHVLEQVGTARAQEAFARVLDFLRSSLEPR